MTATMQTLDAVLKEVYEGSLREQLNHDVLTLRRIEKTAEGTGADTGGRYVTFPIHTRRNTGIGARNENEPLPAAGHQGTAAARIGLKYQYGAIELTGQAIELVDKNYQAFISALELETKGIRRDLAKDLNRQVYSDGTGKIATATATDTSTNVIEVDRPELVHLGMLVDLITLPSTVAVAGRTVESVDVTTGEVTLSGAAFNVTTGQILVRSGSVNREWTGFEKIFSDSGTLYNIDPTVEPVWKSVVDDNGGTGRAVSENLFTTMADQIRVNGGRTTVIFMTLGIRRAYAALLMQQRQFVNTTEFTGGFKGLAFQTDHGEIPMVTDVDAPPGTAWFVNEEEIKLYRSKDWSFMDRDGSKWQRKITSNGEYDAYTARLYQYSELGTGRRNTHGVLKDLNEI